MTDKYAMLTFVSDQTLPQVIAVLQNKQKIDKIFLVVSTGKDSEKYADICKRIEKFFCQDEMCNTEIISVDDAYDFELISETLDNLVRKESADYRLIFNITGGTKPMSIAAFNTAVRESLDVIYVDSDNRNIIHYSNGIFEKEPFNEARLRKIDIKKYYELNGINANFGEISDEDIGLSCIIFENIDFIHSSDFLGKVQENCRKFYYDEKGKIIKKNQNKECYFEIKSECCPKPDEINLLNELYKYGILKYDQKSVVFENHRKYKFFEGTWLEAYSKKCLTGKYFDDIKSSVKLTSESEFDLCVIGQAKIGLIECKASSLNVGEKDITKISSTEKSIKDKYAKSFLIICEE